MPLAQAKSGSHHSPSPPWPQAIRNYLLVIGRDGVALAKRMEDLTGRISGPHDLQSVGDSQP